jgi:hypothetical protein
MFERFTEQARRALFFAREEASQLGSIRIDTEPAPPHSRAVDDVRIPGDPV